MFSKWMASLTNWFRKDLSPSASSSTDSHQQFSFPLTVLQEKESGPGFFAKLTEIFHCRRLADLEKDLRAERDARLLLEGQVSAQRAEITRVNEMLAEALQNERRVYQMHVNIDMQGKHGFVPFPDSPSIPSEVYQASQNAATQIEPDYVNMKNVQARRFSEFRSEVRNAVGTV